MNKKVVVISILLFIVLSLLAVAHYKTGLFSPEGIDEEDITEWEYEENVLISGQEAFSSDGTCVEYKDLDDVRRVVDDFRKIIDGIRSS